MNNTWMRVRKLIAIGLTNEQILRKIGRSSPEDMERVRMIRESVEPYLQKVGGLLREVGDG